MVDTANEVILKRNQAGYETTRGTLAAPTFRMPGNLRVNWDRPLRESPNADGLYYADATFARGVATVDGTYDDDAAYQTLPRYLALAVRTGVVGVSDAHATAPAYTYLINPVTSGTTMPKSASIEHHHEGNVYRALGVLFSEWGLAAEIDGDGILRFTSQLLATADSQLPAGFTAGVPTIARTMIEAAGFKLFMDAPGGTIGTTQVLEQFISFSLTNNNNFGNKRFMENINTASSKTRRGRRIMTGTVRLEMEDSTEDAKRRDGTYNRIRFEQTGELIHASSTTPALPATYYRIRIDLPRAYWISLNEDDREGNITGSYGFRAFNDLSTGLPWQIEIVTNQPNLMA